MRYDVPRPGMPSQATHSASSPARSDKGIGMDLIHVLLLALLQGVTGLFPVSSLGHTVIIPGILGWKETLDSPTFLPLLVTLHLGTSVALLTFFWRDWVQLLRGGLRTVVAGRFTPDVDPDGYGRQLALIVVGTICIVCACGSGRRSDNSASRVGDPGSTHTTCPKRLLSYNGTVRSHGGRTGAGRRPPVNYSPRNLLDPGPRIDLAGNVEIPINNNVVIDSYPLLLPKRRHDELDR